MKWLAAVVCALSCAVPRLVVAAPLGAIISVERTDRASDCPDARELSAHVEQILQRPLPSDAADRLEVLVRFTWSRDQYLASVLSRGAKPGERVLRDRGGNCGALAEAVSVAIAILLDKELEPQVAGGDRRAPRTGAARAAPPRPSAAQPSPDSARAPLEVRASLAGGGAFGLVAQSSPIATEELGLHWERRVVVEAGFNAVLPGTSAYGVGRVRTTLLFGAVRACYAWGSSVTVGPCGSFGIGRLQGVGLDYATIATENLTWTAFGAGAVAEGPMWGRVFWGLLGTLWVPTRRSGFQVQNVGTAWESRPIAGTVALRLGFRIW